MAERRRRLTLRTRVTAASAGLMLVLLTAGAALFVVALDARLADAERTIAGDLADTVEDRIGDGDDPLAGVDADAIVQVQRSGIVTAQTDESADETDGVLLPARDGARITLDGEPYIVASEEEEGRRIVVARSLESAGEATTAASGLLAVAVPVATVLVALLVWLVAGRALRPVERLRAEVAGIPADDLGARVQAPAGAAELGSLADTLNGLLDRIRSSQDAQRRFVADASHELRSPIASLRQHAELAADYPDSTTLAEFGGVVDAETTRLAELVDALLVLARSGEAAAARRDPLDLDELLLAEAARLRALGCDVEVATTPVRVVGDGELLGRALRNLGDNARRHARGRIRLELRDDGPDAVLRVDDDGEGIPTADRDRVFDRFVRLDEARSRDAGGAGLGLAIVAEAARRHHGSARALESPLGGARFEVRLPRS